MMCSGFRYRVDSRLGVLVLWRVHDVLWLQVSVHHLRETTGCEPLDSRLRALGQQVTGPWSSRFSGFGSLCTTYGRTTRVGQGAPVAYGLGCRVEGSRLWV